jgi:hypothetical protein
LLRMMLQVSTSQPPWPEADITARMTRTCVPHRQRLPASWPQILCRSQTRNDRPGQGIEEKTTRLSLRAISAGLRDKGHTAGSRRERGPINVGLTPNFDSRRSFLSHCRTIGQCPLLEVKQKIAARDTYKTQLGFDRYLTSLTACRTPSPWKRKP